jgi:hypothetical protein
MRKTIGFFLIIICGTSICYSQQAVSTAGGEASGTGGTVSYTIGQVSYTTNTDNDGTVTQGVQQPYEIFDIGNAVDDYGISLELSVYPNPASDYLTLKVKNYTSGNLTYQLYDADGKLLENKEIVDAETTIQMDELSPAIYFLKVSNNDTEVKTFKIIKY